MKEKERKLQIYAYEAGTGDFIRVRFWAENDKKYHNIFIDGGRRPHKKEKRAVTFNGVIRSLLNNNEEVIDAVFVTHWDADHIDGVLDCYSGLSEEEMERIGITYMNSGIIDHVVLRKTDISHSVGQARDLTSYLINQKLKWVDSFTQERQEEKGTEPIWTISGTKIWLLSPSTAKLNSLKKSGSLVADLSEDILHDNLLVIPGCFEEEMKVEFEEDNSITNGSSAAFILEYMDARIAFLGDAHPSTCVKGLKALGYTKENPCKVDLIKIPHHGSIRNYSHELYQLLVADYYLLCTNGPKHNGVLIPNKSFMGHLIMDHAHTDDSIVVYCNYSWWENNKHKDYYFKEGELKSRNAHEAIAVLSCKDETGKREHLIRFVNINSIETRPVINNRLELCR